MGKKNRIGIIGNIGDGTQIGGQITKTVELYNFFKSKGESVELLNVYGENPLKLIRKIAGALKNSEHIFIMLASAGYFKINAFIIFLKKKYNCKVHEIVIGGIRHKYIAKRQSRLNMEKKIDYIYVESKYMVNEYRKLGLEQVEYLPNYKKFHILSQQDISRNRSGECLRLCTFSRIDEYKGIDIAIDIIEKINRLDLVRKVRLDIIGPVKEDYKKEFEKIYGKADRNYINYIGTVKTDTAQEILIKYDALLFPTRWTTEGFPGTFIDAFSSGLPIIASDRQNFRDIVEEGINGYLIDDNDLDAFCKVIKEFADDNNKLTRMKNAALESSKKYLSEIVLEKLWRRCR